jgi:hypothetical protein
MARMPAPALEAKLSRKLLATARAAGGEYLAAAGSGSAGTEAVAAGTNEIARLKSALHDEVLESKQNSRPLLGRP